VVGNSLAIMGVKKLIRQIRPDGCVASSSRLRAVNGQRSLRA